MLFAVVTYTCSIVHSIVCLCNMRTANYRDFREKKKKTFYQQKESKMEKKLLRTTTQILRAFHTQHRLFLGQKNQTIMSFSFFLFFGFVFI